MKKKESINNMLSKLTSLYSRLCILNFSVASYNKLCNSVTKKKAAEFIQVSYLLLLSFMTPKTQTPIH